MPACESKERVNRRLHTGRHLRLLAPLLESAGSVIEQDAKLCSSVIEHIEEFDGARSI